ncbi:hypothetical protein CHS0354_035702 [Potamilus streckersoni]|uniref:Uncharacterized protein n=1 Tax=Potamilus streckersoni TaxID=2493646 RepID=A0AAE0WBI6_9BIVA|nr:hypothetical protein CHS0354_035702 [Potamilus streckersoni]
MGQSRQISRKTYQPMTYGQIETQFKDFTARTSQPTPLTVLTQLTRIVLMKEAIFMLENQTDTVKLRVALTRQHGLVQLIVVLVKATGLFLLLNRQQQLSHRLEIFIALVTGRWISTLIIDLTMNQMFEYLGSSEIDIMLLDHRRLT